MVQEVKSISATNVVKFIRLSQKKMGIQSKRVCWQYACIVEGSSYGSIARVLKVNPQSVANWVNQYTAKLPAAPVPKKVRKAELDELYTYVGEKKTKSTFSR